MIRAIQAWALAALCLSAQCALAEIRIATWNIQHLGAKEDKDYAGLAAVAGLSDIIAIQEVMTADAIPRLERELERHTRQEWSSLESHAIGRGSYKERYAFLWRDSTVAYEDGAVVYLDRRDTFEREPFSAQFKERKTGALFVVATAHILYGRSEAHRAPEVKALAEYWGWLDEVYTSTSNRFLMGDFNMPPSDPSWAGLRRTAVPLITSGASTLSSRTGSFRNLYDNVFIDQGSDMDVKKAYVLNYPKLLGISHVEARKRVSDHAPVFVHVELAQDRTSTSAENDLFRREQKPEATMAAMPEMAEQIRGNRNSMIYHRPDCPSYNSVSAANRVSFKSAEQAVQEGYRLAGNCR